MIADLCLSLLVFGALLGLAWPVVARSSFTPAEKLGACAGLSLVGVFLLAWVMYISGANTSWFALIPLAGGLSLALGRRSFAATWRDAEVRALGSAQIIVTGWTLGWLALVVNYSGGTWVGDWFGHWQRTMFFLDRLPVATLFNGFDPVPSRPPLTNVLTAVFVEATQRDFAHYQIATTLLGSLVFLPAALLARRWRPHPAVIPALALLFMANPMFVQNATFAWTKLPTATFVLLALYFFLRDGDARPPRGSGLLWGIMLAAALLSHYSAGPYAVVLGIAAVARAWQRRRDRHGWRSLGAPAGVGAALLAAWFGWAVAVYGVRGTFFTNTTVTDAAPTFAAQLSTIAGNVRDTIVPHALRGVSFEPFAQRSLPGGWRDWFFQFYQVNLLFALGSVAWVAVIVRLGAARRHVSPAIHRSWAACIVGLAVLGTAVHAGRDPWGLAHICLQPLALGGLAFLAAEWPALSTGWRRILLAAGSMDFCLGILLHFGLQSYILDTWLAPGQSIPDRWFAHSQFAAMNVRAKLQAGWVFLGDQWVGHRLGLAAGLALLIAAAVFQAARAQRPIGPR